MKQQTAKPRYISAISTFAIALSTTVVVLLALMLVGPANSASLVKTPKPTRLSRQQHLVLLSQGMCA